jgi:histidinol phosphatase-like PHP family hydrolase
MKDQNSIPDGESKEDKMLRGLDIFIESVHKPDSSLRQCAHNQKCYNELMEIREEVLKYLHTMRCRYGGH